MSEFGVIVVGVLVALAADRWIEGVDQARREAAYLTSLRADFEANRSVAEERLGRERRLEELGRLLLERLESGTGGDPPEVLLIAAEFSAWVTGSQYERGGWDAAMSSGEAILQGDPSLRIAVSNFYRRVERRDRMEAEWQQYYLAYRFAARQVLPPLLRVRFATAAAGFPVDFESRVTQALDGTDLSEAARAVLDATNLATPLADVVMVRGSTIRLTTTELDDIGQILRLIESAAGAL